MEEKKYIFVLYDQDNSIIATSGYFDKYRQLPHLFSLKESKNVMGRGLALAIKNKYPNKTPITDIRAKLSQSTKTANK